jgi:hypothetical protein
MRTFGLQTWIADLDCGLWERLKDADDRLILAVAARARRRLVRRIEHFDDSSVRPYSNFSPILLHRNIKTDSIGDG